MGIKVDIKRKLGEFSLDIHFQTESKRIGILGASGCGKSMTLKSIAGIETPDFGMIQMDAKMPVKAIGWGRVSHMRHCMLRCCLIRPIKWI